jgi:CheY-like chemotaxis protein/two-component sensor histidine kinase
MKGVPGAERERSIIGRQVQHLTRLVDDLLDVSRIARGKIELQREPINLADVVTLAVETASPLLEQRGHHLSINIPPNLTLYADSIRIQQVISNLLTNSAKYTDHGGHIAITANTQEDQIVIRVVDSGIGIAPEMLPRVFDLFTQAPQALDRARGGLGLGLAIVRNIVQLHGGQVIAHSLGRDQGSEFMVSLPRTHTESTESPDTLSQPKPEKISVHGVRVLLVDDNEDALDLLSHALTSRGYRTQTAKDAPEALQVLKDFTPDVAILDIGLPGMDGYELGARIREALSNAPPVLLALTGYGQSNDRERSQTAGFHGHLVKPVQLEDLLSFIQRLLGMRHHREFLQK